MPRIERKQLEFLVDQINLTLAKHLKDSKGIYISLSVDRELAEKTVLAMLGICASHPVIPDDVEYVNLADFLKE